MAQKKAAELTPVSGRYFTPEEVNKWYDDSFLTPLQSFRPCFSALSPDAYDIVPNVDIYEDKGDLVMKADLPGVNKEDVEITLTDGHINISGERRQESEIKKKDYLKWERTYGSFCRTFVLPAEVDADKVKSTFKDGILEIRMPKTDRAKSKEIKVKIQ
ncbi:MAG TPA: Hsp20/alpha crystallin family protein [Smithella sp.]|nr:Hsp20/alpha crystallin family protein [Smithella sp.]